MTDSATIVQQCAITAGSSPIVRRGKNQPFVARGFLPHGMEPAFTSKGPPVVYGDMIACQTERKVPQDYGH